MRKNKVYKIMLSMITVALLLGVCFSLSACNEGGEIAPTATVEEIDTEFVKTPYGKLEYPSEFEDEIEFKISESKKCYTIDAFTEKRGKKIKLYSLYFGEAEGDYIGKISSKGEEVEVYAKIYNQEQASFSSSEMDEIYTAMETINNLIDSVESMSDFSE